MDIRNNPKFDNLDYKTEHQWNQLFKIPLSEAAGKQMWSNRYCKHSYMYYLPEEVREMTDLEIANYKNAKNQVLRAARKRKKERIEKVHQREIKDLKEYYEQLLEETVQTSQRKMGHEFLQYSQQFPIENYSIASKTIIIDTETTGLDPYDDEILQLSIIDKYENILLDSYVKPYWHNTWEQAESINKISPDMIFKSEIPYPHELIPKVKGIFAAADTIIGYNTSFDLEILEKWGIPFQNKKIYDVMRTFAPIYGEWDDYHCDYRFKKLTTCAAYYNYDYNYGSSAHNSLADAKATLYCFEKIFCDEKMI